MKNPYPTAQQFIPKAKSVSRLRTAARDCRGCDLYKSATQVVFGAGSQKAKLLIIGEQPGDEEDQQGKPFVGPSGRLLDKIFTELAISRKNLYLTNAVKHFRWRKVGKRRLHEKPNTFQIQACRSWLIEEIRLIQPSVILCLGSTAAKDLLGPQIKVLTDRGRDLGKETGRKIFVTLHPSAVLRMAPENREAGYALLKADIKQAYQASI